jgi:exopolysaccharide biosynthesis polyprenyl glycosylphosphotransferase
MATSDFWQRVSATVASVQERVESSAMPTDRRFRGSATFWITMDLLSLIGAAFIATLIDLNTTPIAGAQGFWHGTLIRGRSMWILMGLLCWFTLALIVISRRMHLYQPQRLTNYLHEQRLSVQACLTAGLILTGTLYVMHAEDIPRGIVIMTIVLTTITLSLRRFLYRFSLYQKFEQGIGTRNVLILGTGPEAHALRHHIESIQHLGYSFIGFVEMPGRTGVQPNPSEDIVGGYDTLFEDARRLFVDEIFFAAPAERGLIQNTLEQAQSNGVDLRVVPDLYDGLAWNSPIEYVGQFPTIPLHRGHVPESALLLKRMLDIVLGTIAMVILLPILTVIAIAIKIDSPGPIFYKSDRLGKKGRVFKCIKFRTMVQDAEKRRADMLHMNERDGVLFKIANDPRITQIGGFLRKYSLDELPQFFNVLIGDMSLVGPRPPIASEVREYKLSHLRRLDVTPGVTGLWQVQARQDPSFDSYISLDVAYIENWSIWLDIKIIVRTIGVVFSGTGS